MVIVDVAADGEPSADVQDGRYDPAPGSQAETVTVPASPGGLTRRRTYGAGQCVLLPAGWLSATTTA